MSLKTIMQRFVPMRRQRTSKREPLSIVLLLRKPHLFTAAELRLAAQRARHRSFDGEEKQSGHRVAQKSTVTPMKAGPHLLNFFCHAGPYVENPKENVDWLSQARQRHHSGCLGVDYLNDGVSVELGYCVLAQLVAELLDGNCTGIYERAELDPPR
jgi:hypothetical protein